MALIAATVLNTQTIPEPRLIDWFRSITSIADFTLVIGGRSIATAAKAASHVRGIQNKSRLVECHLLDASSGERQIWSALWEEVRLIANDGDWVLLLEADEFHDNHFISTHTSFLTFLEANALDLVYFKVCDMWDDSHYRIDGDWSQFQPRLIRFRDGPFGLAGASGGLRYLPFYAQECRAFVSDFRLKRCSPDTATLRQERCEDLGTRGGIHTESTERSVMSPPELAMFGESIHWPSVLLVTPIRNRDWILPDFLFHIECLDYPTQSLHLHFTCNNCDDGSVATIESWRRQSRFRDQINVEVVNFANAQRGHDRDWTDGVIHNLSAMRTRHLELLRHSPFTYLFSVDSDLLLHPRVLKVSILQDRKIISPVFWADWDVVQQGKLPQCWQYDVYGFSKEWLTLLRSERTRVKCGGLGAQTLIHKAVSKHENINYLPIYNVSNRVMWGEDRWFCMRAVCHGFELWCHTYTESIHVDRPTDLVEARATVVKDRWHQCVFRS